MVLYVTGSILGGRGVVWGRLVILLRSCFLGVSFSEGNFVFLSGRTCMHMNSCLTAFTWHWHFKLRGHHKHSFINMFVCMNLTCPQLTVTKSFSCSVPLFVLPVNSESSGQKHGDANIHNGWVVGMFAGWFQRGRGCLFVSRRRPDCDQRAVCYSISTLW